MKTKNLTVIKEETRKSNKRVQVRFKEKEYTKILKVADKQNKSIHELLRTCYETVNGKPIEIPKKELAELTGQIKRIGNNVNNAIRKINTGQFHMLEDIKDSLEMSSTELKIILGRIGKIL